MQLIKELFERAKGFLLNPKAAFDAETKTDIWSAFKYMAIWLIITGILSAVVLAIGGASMTSLIAKFIPLGGAIAGGVTAGLTVSTFFSVWIGGIVGAIVLGLWLHLWAYLLGARNKLENTFKTVFYGNTPTYVLGWIPFVSIVGAIWSLVLYTIGLTHLQKMPTGRAIGAVVIAIVIPLVLMLALLASLLAAIGTLGAFAL